MTGVRDFFAGLAEAGKSFDEIKETADLAFGDKSLHESTIYCGGACSPHFLEVSRHYRVVV